MTLLWIGIGIGIVFSAFLIRKYFKTQKFDYYQFSLNCQSCGGKTNTLKCQKCDIGRIPGN